jgi:hypothetical protein
MKRQWVAPGHRATVAGRSGALIVACAVVVVAAACGSGAPSGGTASTLSPAVANVVVAPDFTLQGCTYVLNGTIPPGEPQGVKPGLPAFSPDRAAVSALEKIRSRGGTAMVDGVTFPAGTSLYPGPDTSGSKVGVIPAGNSILAAEPVVWTARDGGTWLAFFLACGGQHLYWVSVMQLQRQNPQFASAVTTQLAQLAKAAPYDRTGSASLLPIVVDGQHHLVWADPKVTFPVGRGAQIGT